MRNKNGESLKPLFVLLGGNRVTDVKMILREELQTIAGPGKNNVRFVIQIGLLEEKKKNVKS